MNASALSSLAQSSSSQVLTIGKLDIHCSFSALNDGNRTVRIYDASTGTASGEAWSAGQTSSIRAIAISPDNKILAAGGHDCSIVLFNMDTRSMINQTIRGHTGVRGWNILHTPRAHDMVIYRRLDH